MTVNFLLKAAKLLTIGEYSRAQLEIILNYVLSVDNEILNDYNNTCTVLSYDNDLQLYIEVLDYLIKICEENEEYETCEKIKNKKDDAIIIMETKTI